MRTANSTAIVNHLSNSNYSPHMTLAKAANTSHLATFYDFANKADVRCKFVAETVELIVSTGGSPHVIRAWSLK